MTFIAHLKKSWPKSPNLKIRTLYYVLKTSNAKKNSIINLLSFLFFRRLKTRGIPGITAFCTISIFAKVVWIVCLIGKDKLCHRLPHHYQQTGQLLRARFYRPAFSQQARKLKKVQEKNPPEIK